MFYAHTKGENQDDWQELKVHLINTSIIAKNKSADSEISELSEICALLHDVGKYSSAFQNRLLGSGKPVDHSTAGAQLITQLAKDSDRKKFIAKILAFCIAGHHSGLPDFGSPSDHYSSPTLLGRLKRPIEEYSDYSKEFSFSDLQIPDRLPIKPTRKNGQFSVSFLVRMIYSALVDADYLDTEKFFDPLISRCKYPSIDGLHDKMVSFLQRYSSPQSNINIKRTELLEEALTQAKSAKGLFSLTIPTGGGKTYTSLAFALTHAKKHGLKRIIYCIPFTSIIEQNADVIRGCLGSDAVLEHHSNFDWNEFRNTQNKEIADDQTNALIEKLKLSSENWDIPIIVTTNVQFFESLFSNRSSKCRKLHSLINSVIIFDEAQVLPVSYLEPCMLSLAELMVNYNSSVIFSTATQPPLHQFFPEIIRQRELISSPNDVYQFFKRVTVVNLGTQNDDQISQSINSTRQALCIVNTRRHAKGLFNQIESEGRFHLSTLMCPAHRKKVIKEIRSRLDNDDVCRVISTQIMEAGIDVDFPVGFRALAGLDSIVQAAGRVNRENKRDIGILNIFKPYSDFIKRVPSYIKQTTSVAEIIIDQYDDPISLEAITAYYNLLYDIQDSHVFDKKEIMSCFEKGIVDEPDFDFKTASERFKMIENDTFPIIIPFDDQAEELIQKLRFSDFPASLLRPLQLYTVNIYSQELASLFALSNIESLHDRFLVLSTLEEVYNDETGLVIPENATGDAIFISS